MNKPGAGRPSEPVKASGKTYKSLTACCQHHGQHHQTVLYRINKMGMTLQQALKPRTKAEILQKALNITIDRADIITRAWIK